MKVVIQRVLEASVTVEGETVGRISHGMLVLAGVVHGDTDQDIAWIAQKLVTLRVFREGEKHFDRDVLQVGGSVLLVSQFTLAGDARKGRRPSFDEAARPEFARPMFERLVSAVRATGAAVQTGQFAA